MMNKNSNLGGISYSFLAIFILIIFGVLTNFKLIWTMIPIVIWWIYFDWKKWPKILAEKGPTVYDKLYK